MELHQLRYFVALVKAGNFSRAAVACRITQPSLSQQIKKLEDELGEPLLIRKKNQTVPTEAGNVLLDHARRILLEVGHAERAMKEIGGLVKGSVSFGILPTIAPYVLPSVIPAFVEAYPHLRLDIVEEKTEELNNRIADGELDFAVLSPPVPDRFMVEELFVEELFLAVPRGHPLARSAEVFMKDLESEDFILMQEGHCLSDQIRHFCDQTSTRLRVVFRSTQLDTIQSLIQSKMGVSLIPAMARKEQDYPDIEYRKLNGEEVSRAIAVAYQDQAHLSGAARAFIRILKEVVGEDGRQILAKTI